MSKPFKFEGKPPTLDELWKQKIPQDVGWAWPNGRYRVIDLSTNKVIASNIQDPLQFMLDHGIPNVEWLYKAKVQQSQKDDGDEPAALRLAKLEEACKFRHVEKSNLTSASQPLGTEGDFSNEILSDESITAILNKDVYKDGLSSDGSWRLSPNHILPTLKQVRIFIRRNEVFTKSRLNEKTLLSLRLWAALSPAPLPVFDLKKYREQHSAATSTTITENPPAAGHTTTRAPSRRVSGASNEGSSSNEDNTNSNPEPDPAPVSGRVSEVGTATENARSMENITGNNNNNTSSTHPHHGPTTAGRLSDNSRSYMNNARSVAAKQQDSDDSSSDYEDSSDEESDESSSHKMTSVAKGRAASREKSTVNNNSRPTHTSNRVASAKAQQPARKQDSQSKYSIQSQGRAAQNMHQASTHNNSSRFSHTRSLKAPHPLQLQAQKQQSQTSRGGGAVQNLRQEKTSRDKRDNNNGNRKRKADDDQVDGSELFQATFDYEKMTTKSIRDSTKELKRKVQRLQIVNGIIAEALGVEEKIRDFNKENLRDTDDNTGGDNNNLLPLLAHKRGMEWDEIDQAEKQAKSELQRLKAKLSALQQRKHDDIQEHKKAVEELYRASQHPLARRIP